MSNETILVSAYMSDVFNVPGLDASQYIKYAEPLLMLPKKKIIFVDSTIFYKVYNTPKHSSTVLIPFDKKKLEVWWPETSDVTLPKVRSQKKDTFRYLRVQMYKVMWLKEVINMFGEDNQYMWIDFGYFKLLNGNKKLYTNDITKAISKTYNNIRLPGQPIKIPSNIKIPSAKKEALKWFKDNGYLDFQQGCPFFFLGGILGGKGSSIKILANEVEEWKNELKLMNCATWEVVIWWYVYLKNPDLFIPYKSKFHTILSYY
jgi:hypothetical protein